MILIEAIAKGIMDIRHAKKVVIKYDDGIVMVYRVQYPTTTIVRIDYRLNKNGGDYGFKREA